MPRFKQRLTETLTHKTGQKVDCFYDPNDKLFKAEPYIEEPSPRLLLGSGLDE